MRIEAALAIALVAGPPALGATTRSWSISTADEFSRGTLEGTAIDEEGRVRLALGVETLWGPGEGVVWKIAPDDRGGAFVALSSPGRVVHVDGSGGVEVWFEAGGENLVAAVAADGRGGVYLGVSPLGRVLHATGPGAAEVVAETGALYVWGLDAAPDGSLWIGTGTPGRLARLEAGGSLVTAFESGDDPVRCVRALDDGGVVIGTGGRGRVIRFDRAGRPFVVLDADEPEIVDVAAGEDGTLFALAARRSKHGRAMQEAAAAVPVPEEAIQVVTAPAPDDEEEKEEPAPQESQRRAPSPARRPGAPGGAVLYRLDRGGGALPIWSAAAETPFALARSSDGRLFVATGDLGRVHRLDERGRTSMVLEIPSDQASALAATASGAVWIGASTDARVARLGGDVLDRGTYLSSPIDAGAVAVWGRVSWEADEPPGSELSVAVRSGNTDEPDATWSDWVDLGRVGGGGTAPEIPATRWFQARVEMSASRQGASPLLRRLEALFVPGNRPPRIGAIAVQPAGLVWSVAPAQSARPRGPVVADDPVTRDAVKGLEGRSTAAVRKIYEQGARTVTWDAEDPDGDTLAFAVEIRREGAEAWLPLATGIEQDYVGWDARRFSDGLYRLRLTADDAKNNPEGRELVDRRTSPIFRVDNSRPSVAQTRIRGAGEGFDVEFVARDAGGYIAAVEFAVDGGPWEPLEPQDGVADSPEERCRVRIGRERLAAAARAIHIRVTDDSGNVGGDAWPLAER